MLRSTVLTAKPSAAINGAVVNRRSAVVVRASSSRWSGGGGTAPSAADSAARLAATGALSVLVAATLYGSPAAAADLALGAQVFNGNCAACHAGGGNTVLPDHTLQKAAIEQFLTGGLTLEAIQTQVENGKGAMPAWSGTLSDEEIEAVSNYVFDQATNSKW